MEFHQLLPQAVNAEPTKSAKGASSALKGNLYAVEFYGKQQIFRTNLNIASRLAGGKQILIANCDKLTSEHFDFEYIEESLTREIEQFIGLEADWFNQSRQFYNASVLSSARSVNIASLITESNDELVNKTIDVIENYLGVMGVMDSFADTSGMLSEFFDMAIELVDADSVEACSAFRTIEAAIGLELGSLDKVGNLVGE